MIHFLKKYHTDANEALFYYLILSFFEIHVLYLIQTNLWRKK